MPAGLPPGAEYLQDERPPEGVYYFRIYGGITAVLYASVAVLGLILMFTPLFAPRGSKSDTGAWIAGLFYGGLGAAFLTPTLLALFGGRKPWVHTLGTVVIGLGMTQVCCIPLLIPLLITWLKPECKRWYGTT